MIIQQRPSSDLLIRVIVISGRPFSWLSQTSTMHQFFFGKMEKLLFTKCSYFCHNIFKCCLLQWRQNLLFLGRSNTLKSKSPMKPWRGSGPVSILVEVSRSLTIMIEVVVVFLFCPYVLN